jgi:hypothetical protein
MTSRHKRLVDTRPGLSSRTASYTARVVSLTASAARSPAQKRM